MRTNFGAAWRERRVGWVAVGCAGMLLLAACGQSGTEDPSDVDTTSGEAPGPDTTGGTDTSGVSAGGELSDAELRIAINGEYFINQVGWVPAQERFLPDRGFEDVSVVFTEETVPALLGGSVWAIQDNTETLWPAIDEEVGDLVVVGVDKIGWFWVLGAREGIDSVADLAGHTIAAGPIGDPWRLVAEEILEANGVDPADVEFAGLGGGSDARAQAVVAGQVDAAMLQLRHIDLIEEEGGTILVNEVHEIPQELWVVDRGFLEEHRDSVCAYVAARVEGRQFVSAGADGTDNRDEALEIIRATGIDPTEAEVADWSTFVRSDLSPDGGATVESFDRFQSFLKEAGELSEDFDWRDSVDLECLWQAQSELGIPENPDPGGF